MMVKHVVPWRLSVVTDGSLQHWLITIKHCKYSLKVPMADGVHCLQRASQPTANTIAWFCKLIGCMSHIPTLYAYS